MTLRSMKTEIKGRELYSSTFDTETGTLVRILEKYEGVGWDRWSWLRRIDGWNDRYPHRHEVFSPSPETVDISITDKCGFGCDFCYQDSKPNLEHAPKELVETVLKGFETPPYQIAIGGGEPTQHLDLPYILERARSFGTVPNYTTNGAKLSEGVVEATNRYCGGVAMTYHAFKGIDWFVKHFTKLRKALKVQVNVHVIFDHDVAQNLRDLSERLRGLNIVLLAYYPDVGRAYMDKIPGKAVYQRDFPDALKAARAAGFKIAFSEGLLPYFLSRPELGVDTTFATRSEGLYSCYVDPRGRMSASSFYPPWGEGETVYEKSAQEMWENVWARGEPDGPECSDCKHFEKCATPSNYHYFLCSYTAHNQKPLKKDLRVLGGDHA